MGWNRHIVGSSILFRDELGLHQKPPLLTFILVNWNYGRYLGRMIDSILSQTYERFECVVVDNCSSDDSREVAIRHIGGDPRFRTVFLSENLGQLGATLLVADTIGGDYVCVVDADDFLFPDYARSHLRAHASSETRVGVTTSNFIEVDAQSELMAGARSRFDRAAAVRPADGGIALPCAEQDPAASSAPDCAVGFFSNTTGGWIWAHGTSNVYDRTCFERACRIAPKSVPRTYAADTWFLGLCHALLGTRTLDIPLSAYRIHGKNAENGPRLLNWQSHSLAGQQRSIEERIDMCCAVLRNMGEVFSWGDPDFFWRALRQIPRHRSLWQSDRLQKELEAQIDMIANRCSDDEILTGLAQVLSRKDALRVIGVVSDRTRRNRFRAAVSKAGTGWAAAGV